MQTNADALRRWLGMFCLAVATGLLIWGRTVFEPHLRGLAFLLYWLICLGFTLAAIVIALLDIRAVRRRTREERRELVQRISTDIEASADRKRDDPAA